MVMSCLSKVGDTCTGGWTWSTLARMVTVSYRALSCSWLRVITWSSRLATLSLATFVGEACTSVCGCNTISRSSQRLDFFTWHFDSSTVSMVDSEQARRFLIVFEKPTMRLCFSPSVMTASKNGFPLPFFIGLTLPITPCTSAEFDGSSSETEKDGTDCCSAMAIFKENRRESRCREIRLVLGSSRKSCTRGRGVRMRGEYTCRYLWTRSDRATAK